MKRHTAWHPVDPRWLHAVALVASAIVFAVVLARARRSEGYYWADDYMHLQISRAARTDVGALLSVWGRPLMTLTYMPAAEWGDGPVRATSLALFGLTGLACVGIVRRRGASWGAGAALLLFGQPLAATLAYGALPGTVFSLVLAVALWLRATDRHVVAALVASLLPMARLEGFLALALWGIVLLREHRLRCCPVLGVGVAAWAVAGAMHSGDPLWLWHSNVYGFLGSHYPRAGWMYLFSAFPLAAGPVVGALALLALAYPTSGDRIAGVLAVGFGAFYAAVWGLPAFQSCGDPVYLVSASVPFALCAHQALTALYAGTDRRTTGETAAIVIALLCVVHEPRMASVGLLIVVTLLLAADRARDRLPRAALPILAGLVMLATAVTAIHLTRRLRLEPGARLAKQTITRLGPRIDRVVQWSHPAFGWYARRFPTTAWERLGDAMPGSFVVWDAHFGGKEDGITDEMLRRSGYEPVWQGRWQWARSVLWEKHP